jgi:hypothetical protein
MAPGRCDRIGHHCRSQLRRSQDRLCTAKFLADEGVSWHGTIKASVTAFCKGDLLRKALADDDDVLRRTKIIK